MKTQVFFSGALSGIAKGWLESYVLYLAWPEWKGLKFYCPLCFHPFWWKHRGIAGGSQGEYHKISGNVWVEPWVGLQGANKSAPLGWVGNWKTPRAVLYLLKILFYFLIYFLLWWWWDDLWPLKIIFLLSRASLFFVWFVVLRPSQQLIKVMLRRSVNRTTLFLGRHHKWLTSTKCTSFCK